ncbi:hypothetical protein [Marinibactrum halimedae]|nr:hypothetical protein [Marinibactrum halimedae]MCD9460807.1 hypothetical protein [Marinibactrum halimedae]
MTELTLWFLLQVGMTPVGSGAHTSEPECPPVVVPNGGTGGTSQPLPK